MKIKVIVWVVLLFALNQCNYEPKQEEKAENVVEKVEKEHIRIVYPNWAEGIALTNLLKVILIDYLNYDVIIKMENIENIYAGIASGQYDVFPDAWLPYTHNTYWEKYGGEVQKLGVIFENARIGIVAPDYVEPDSIGDIKHLKMDSLFIYGIDSLSGVMKSAKLAKKLYALPVEVRLGNEVEMISKLEQAYLERESFFFTGWEPHWVFSRYDLKFLSDPDSVFGGTEQINIIGRKGICEDYPNLCLFLERVSFSDKQMNSLLNEVNAFEDYPERGVKNWIDDNKATVNKWIHGLRVKRRYSM